MKLSPLTAVSPIDGRYHNTTKPLADYFSEGALIKYRIQVEVEYFISLCQIPLPQLEKIDQNLLEPLRGIYRNFSYDDAEKVKIIEKTTNHDVKAVEYFLKEKWIAFKLEDYKEFIHFGLTSQDVNHTALPLLLKDAWLNVLQPTLADIVNRLNEKAMVWKNVPMLARTHGQPASPTTMGKEIYVFVDRLKNQAELLETIPFAAKFGGATGNFNAHHAAYPGIDWIAFGNHFVKEVLGLDRYKVTTQIEHYDHLAAFCDNLKRINTILIDLNRDLWSYISMEYFKQKVRTGEIGSSTMPHKINPIDFENSEGNLGLANAIFEHLSAKLPVSRLQRDLTDSTVSRNLGVPVAHTLIAFKSLLRGLNKLIINEVSIKNDLQNNWAVITEAIQTILRREGYPRPYEALKTLTQEHSIIDQQAIAEFVDALDVPSNIKDELKKISPENYTGIFDLY